MKKKNAILILAALLLALTAAGCVRLPLAAVPVAAAEEIAENIESAGINRKRGGRKPKYSAEIDNLILEMKAAGKSIRDIAKATGCSIGYVHSQKTG